MRMRVYAMLCTSSAATQARVPTMLAPGRLSEAEQNFG